MDRIKETKELKDMDEMPIVKSVIDYRNKKTVPLHMPGHKKGESFRNMGMELPWAEALEYDTTEVDMIDNLHFPEGAILEGEEKAAKLFGADKTYFLANGTTIGILAMIHAVTQPGDSIIIPRNCHKSVFNAIVLGRLNPIFIQPEIDTEYGVAMGISPMAVEEAFRKNPEAKAVIITSPTYYGVCSDLETIAKIAHGWDRLLLVDEAHGAHFGFSEICPRSALDCGADAVAQSTHKCLSAFTGTSMLHIKGNSIDREKLRFYLQAYQTSSPNHLLLAGLDSARYQMEKQEGKDHLERVAMWGLEAKLKINEIPGLKALDDDIIGKAGAWEVDPTRLTVSVKALGISGTVAEHFLREKFNIQLEMADLYNVIAIYSIGDKKESFDIFVEGLKVLSKEHFGKKEIEKTEEQRDTGEVDTPFSWKLPEIATEPWTAMLGEKKILPIAESVGEVAAELVVPYPPGIPVLMPGERISQTVVEYISKCLKSEIKINSSAGNVSGYISVILEKD